MTPPRAPAAAPAELIRLARAVQLWIDTFGRAEVELNAVRVFLTIALSPGARVQQQHIGSLCDLSESSVSRNLALLGPGTSIAKPGPGLVEAELVPGTKGRKLITLTKDGAAFARRLADTLKEV